MILTTDEIVQLLSSKGFKGYGLVVGSSIVLAESGGDTEAKGLNPPDKNCPNGSLDRGIWQFNDCYHEDVSNDCAYNADCSTEKAYEVSEHGTNFQQWSTFGANAYRRFIPQVVESVHRLGLYEQPPTTGEITVSIEVPASWVNEVSEKLGIESPIPGQNDHSQPTARMYEVVAGDSLFSIAEHYTGDGNTWPHLYTLNSEVIGPDPNLIHPGQVYTIPADWPNPAE